MTKKNDDNIGSEIEGKYATSTNKMPSLMSVTPPQAHGIPVRSVLDSLALLEWGKWWWVRIMRKRYDRKGDPFNCDTNSTLTNGRSIDRRAAVVKLERYRQQ